MKMRDVAKYSGVSVATVSRVLKGDSNVTQKTKEKVLKAVEELNYVPNTLARNLSKMQSKMIVVVIPNLSNAVFSSIYRGIQEVLKTEGYQVILVETYNGVDPSVIELIRNRTVEGAILLSAVMTEEEFNKKLKDLPIVLATDHMSENISTAPSVSIDNFLAAEKAVNYLANLGHKRIAYFGGIPDVLGARRRLKGYKNGLIQNGLEIDESLIFSGDWSLESGYQLANQLLLEKQLPTAIFAVSDNMAIGAIKALKEHGFQIPEDMSIIGFDDIEVAKYVTPSLTTIEQPTIEIGTHAAKMLLTIIKDKPLDQMHVVLNSHLVIRDSCKKVNRSL
ncbi:LacI family DNA-binding transcriptional regulator [Alkalihalophilus pseudofirmus]|uniref:LacI family DNA-binding transcriptional regulator n=1 Tax=Alkalihalophilus pseudofirmus TaxID=79885 RepID=UPI00259B3A45|nr:LacI family DNA-binding transcriptional regulator [Alkalihalophilus pseudofirmus]WEG18865.1 LacI family DNA-binding transcriptional regulator [Alkalihalophilus pseudofirmus]